MVVGSVSVAMALVLVLAPFVFVPDEDAAILFQYSKNLVRHGSVSYNISDGPAEGATDFLWMLGIAAFSWLGVNEYMAANLLSAAALLATAPLAARLLPLRRPLALVIFGGALAASPMMPAGVGGYSALPFGLLLLATAALSATGSGAGFYLVGLATALFRPDGCIFVAVAGICRWASLARRPGSLGANLLTKRELAPLLVAASLGIAYFGWRWRYFGEPLPLPLVVKSSCSERLLVFCRGGSLRLIGMYGAFAAAALALFLLRAPPSRRPTGVAVFLSMVAAPLAAYSFVSLEQNIADRFFYPTYLAAIALLALGADAGARLDRRSRIAVAALAVMAPLLLWRTVHFWRDLGDQRANNHVQVALGLREIRPPGRLGVTEAGILAYLSEWPTTDLWGLNTRRFAHRLASPAGIRAERFDLVAVHADRYDAYGRIADYCGREGGERRSWGALVVNIFAAMCEEVPSRYELLVVPFQNPRGPKPAPASAFRSSQEARYDAYFLRRDFAGYRQVRLLLISQGALEVESYRRLMQHSPSRGGR